MCQLGALHATRGACQTSAAAAAAAGPGAGLGSNSARLAAAHRGLAMQLCPSHQQLLARPVQQQLHQQQAVCCRMPQLAAVQLHHTAWLGSSSSSSSRSRGGSGLSTLLHSSARHPAAATFTAAAGDGSTDAAQLAEAEPDHQQQQQQQQSPGVVTAVLDEPGGQQAQRQQEQQQQQQQVSGLAPRAYSPLHYDIQAFVRHVVPTQEEKAERQHVIQCVAVATRRSFEDTSGIKVQPFGSFVNGLSTWNSDIDLVVTGLVQPNGVTGGFAGGDKRLVFSALERIANQLRRYRKLPIRKMIIIRTARIPIIKLETTTRVTADISLGDSSGPRAANYIAQQVAAYPPLAPLTLVLKVFLRSCGLNEVSNGGLSSFSLTNMVLAHLMQELQEGRDVYDLGEALYGFLARFGDEFDIRRDAVSVALGGCVARQEVDQLAGPDGGLGLERLLIEDPLTGRDVASGSYRIAAIQAAFRRAARRLEQLASRYYNDFSSGDDGSSDGSSDGSRRRQQQQQQGRVNYLEGLFHVEQALSREGRGPRGSGRLSGRGLGLLEGGGVVADEYYVLDRSGRSADADDYAYQGAYDSSLELPLEGDDYGDELEVLYGDESSGGRGSGRGRRKQQRRRS